MTSHGVHIGGIHVPVKFTMITGIVWQIGCMKNMIHEYIHYQNTTKIKPIAREEMLFVIFLFIFGLTAAN